MIRNLVVFSFLRSFFFDIKCLFSIIKKSFYITAILYCWVVASEFLKYKGYRDNPAKMRTLLRSKLILSHNQRLNLNFCSLSGSKQNPYYYQLFFECYPFNFCMATSILISGSTNALLAKRVFSSSFVNSLPISCSFIYPLWQKTS